MENKFVSVVVYLHNDETRIERFLELIISYFNDTFSKYEIVCVDDGCIDDSINIVRNFIVSNSINALVNVVHMSFYQGLENAMNAGRDVAIGDFVFEFDTVNIDFDKTVITELYEKMLSGYDVVSARSDKKGRVSSRVFYKLFNMTSRSNEKIGPETFRIISRRAINRIKAMGLYIPYRKAMYMNCGLKTATVSYKSNGASGYVNSSVQTGRVNLALDSFIYFTNVLERISMAISFLFLFLLISAGVYLIKDYFSVNKPVEGWLSTMGFMAIGFWGVFVLLTIVLKYLSVMLNLIFKNQKYIVEGIEKIGK